MSVQDECLYCRNERKLLDGSDCPHCEPEIISFDEIGVSCLTVPEQYRGVMFDRNLVSDVAGDRYPVFLYQLFQDISGLKLRHKNIFIGSPNQCSKKVWGYACIQALFRKNVEVFPLLDILEIKKIMQDMDRGREPKYLEGYDDTKPLSLYTAPYLFVILQPETSFDVYDTIATLKDRRVRRGNTTIFLHSGTWEYFIDNDRKGSLKYSVGDGSFGTIENRSFSMRRGN